MCDNCGRDFGTYEVKIDNGKKKYSYCLNCIALFSYANRLNIESGEFTSEISGSSGAVKVVLGGDEYFVTVEEAKRLLNYGLMPNEYTVLNHNHGGEFLIHDDFYHNDGLASQPTNESVYYEELEKWAETHANKSQKQEIKQYLEEFK